MQLLAYELVARKATASATSAGVPKRLSGMLAWILDWFACAVSVSEGRSLLFWFMMVVEIVLDWY